MMMPLYGFLEGDTIGLLVFAYKNDTIQGLAEKMQQSSRMRVGKRASPKVIYKGRELDPAITVEHAGLEALERIDVAWK